jgi:hypothetical protein
MPVLSAKEALPCFAGSQGRQMLLDEGLSG